MLAINTPNNIRGIDQYYQALNSTHCLYRKIMYDVFGKQRAGQYVVGLADFIMGRLQDF